ncbi:MAG: Dabb family protein [Cytophagales bacterium]|nr:Dabb family protein [Cytophagales bacterium]
MNPRRKFIKSTSLLVAAAGTFGYHVAYTKNNMYSNKSVNKKGMLQHNVYFWFKEGVSEKDKKGFENGLKKFLGAVKEVQEYEIGIPAGTPDREVVDKSFGYSIFVRFKNVDDHNVYQKHTAHDEFINNFSGLWARVLVMDSEIM